jgi:hypothetical protein
MTLATIARRLERLESNFGRGGCETCLDHPHRIIYEEPDTGVVWYESLPERGCPACGRPIMSVLCIVIPDDAATRAALEP